MERNLLYFINPVSGTKRKPLLKETIENNTTARGFTFQIEETRSDGNYSYLKEKILNENITDIVVCGGDGSVSTITSFLLDTKVNIGIVPTGSGNGLALAAAIPYATEATLKVIFDGHASFVDGFRINEKFSCMMCGIGCDAQVAHDFANKKVRGLKNLPASICVAIPEGAFVQFHHKNERTFDRCRRFFRHGIQQQPVR